MRPIHQFARAEDATAKALSMLRAYQKESARIPVVVFDIDDTLIFDNDERASRFRYVPRKEKYAARDRNQPVIHLLQNILLLGGKVHIVTARLDDPDNREYTVQQLRDYGIEPSMYESLSLAPEAARTSMEAVSHWKRSSRKHISAKSGLAVTLTIGDQWGDVVGLESNDIRKHDKHIKSPFAIVRVRDSAGLWGLKLPSRM